MTDMTEAHKVIMADRSSLLEAIRTMRDWKTNTDLVLVSVGSTLMARGIPLNDVIYALKLIYENIVIEFEHTGD